ncbi:MAG: hypothetical protein NTX88_02860 [Candidatus Atribacteria bacterium]|nr:hypothetical protein [Candidatus Atribacteria bacterium]
MDNIKKWIWVCCQHPMPLLVQDRGVPDVLERIPPWGDPDLSSYINKFKEVFDSLEKYPNFRIDFEISGRELEDVAESDPALISRMKDLIQAGKLGFVGGDYSQSHCHVYGAESSLRQITLGKEVFRKLLDYEVDIFFHQETGLHDQLPQLLRAWGYSIAVPPRFPYVVRFIENESPEITVHYGVIEYVNGEDFTLWKGLDGTTIPLFLSMPAPSESKEIYDVFDRYSRPGSRKRKTNGVSPFESFMEREKQKDPVQVPTLLIENPDMKRLDEEYYRERDKTGEFSLLGPALFHRLKSSSITSSAQLYTYWSYIEGVWAEEMSRKNKRAEISALQAEALDAMKWVLAGSSVKPEVFDSIWKKILSSQHHDVYWIETTDLKRKSLAWLDEAIQASESISREAGKTLATQIDTRGASSGKALVLFNTLPRLREQVERISLRFEKGEVYSLNLNDRMGKKKEFQVDGGDTWEDGSLKNCEILLQPHIPGFGYKTYSIHAGDSHPAALVESDISLFQFENDSYSIKVHGDGTISSLQEKRSGREMINPEKYFGNEIRGRLPNGKWITNRSPRSIGRAEKGNLADLFLVEGQIGPIVYHQKLCFYHDSPLIDFILDLDFGDEGLALGDFWDDTTKLNLYWPLNTYKTIWYDIPFGMRKGKPGRPLYCIDWIDCSDEQSGFSFINRGTTKHRVQDGVLMNCLAWGGNHFSNRNPGLWENVERYDIRLFGKHRIQYSVVVHPGDWRETNTYNRVEEFSHPIQSIVTDAHPGKFPEQLSVFENDAPGFIVTSIHRGENQKEMIARGYETYGKTILARTGFMIESNDSICSHSLDGEEISTVSPYQIIEMTIKKGAK